jgi:ABC-2 type transport system ATP-binding protein
VLVSSHLMSEMEKMADDVVIIAGGRVVAAGTAGEVRGGYDTVEDAFFALTAERPGRRAHGSEDGTP